MKRNSKNSLVKHFDFVILDIACLILSYFAGYFIRFSNDNAVSNDLYKNLFVIVIFLNIVITFFFEPYKNVLKRDFIKEIRISIEFDLISLFTVALYLFLFKLGQDFSRLSIVYIYFIYFFSSLITRLFWKKCINDKAKKSLTNGEKSLLVVCKKNEVSKIIDSIEQHNYDFYNICGIYYVDSGSEDFEFKNYKTINRKDLVSYVSTNWVDDIFIACDYNEVSKDILDCFSIIGVPIHIKLNDDAIFIGKEKFLNQFATYNVITSVNKSYNNWQLFLKKCLDVFGGIIGSIITLLLIVVIGPIIYIKSPGNIFYVSNRVGLNGKTFKFYKFRSMVTNADDLKEDLQSKNIIEDGMMFKMDDDPRIILGIGKFIRSTSIDEFPQFFNVLKGDMSLVGTRPPTIDEWEKYTPYYRSRLSIKPGITGLWQVSGRSKITDFNEVVRLDNEYIDNWSIGLDIRIILKTVVNIFKKDKGAM